jgi:hypothetical protein
MSGQHLQLVIGIFAVWMAYKMFRGAHAQIDPNKHLPSAPLQFAAGAELVSHPRFLVLGAGV